MALGFKDSKVGRFRAANRHFKQAGNIAEHYAFKAPLVGGLPRQIHHTKHPSYSHIYVSSANTLLFNVNFLNKLHNVEKLVF
jgi:hypothetical protein